MNRDAAEKDTQFTDYSVHHYDDKGDLMLETGSTGMYLDPKLVTSETRPKAGDTVRLFGKGFGYVVRGIGRVVNGKLEALYHYETEEEEAQSHRKRVEGSNAKKRAAWEADKEKNARRIANMPDAFKQRFAFFMRNPDWGWGFGHYELFVCEEAVRFARRMQTEKELIAFAKLPWADQKQLDPNLSSDHSGNTFGAAIELARIYVTKPELVPQMHGALCALVGCKDYGCFASTPEAKKA